VILLRTRLNSHPSVTSQKTENSCRLLTEICLCTSKDGVIFTGKCNSIYIIYIILYYLYYEVYVGRECVCLFVRGRLNTGAAWNNESIEDKATDIFREKARCCVSTERAKGRDCMSSRTGNPSGGFCSTREVKPLLALKSQTQDYVSEEVVWNLIHDFCGWQNMSLCLALRLHWHVAKCNDVAATLYDGVNALLHSLFGDDCNPSVPKYCSSERMSPTDSCTEYWRAVKGELHRFHQQSTPLQCDRVAGTLAGTQMLLSSTSHKPTTLYKAL
jgi:hypothetical protein